MVVETIESIIQWLDQNSKSHQIVEISKALNKLAILSMTLSEDVSNAYTAMNEAEDLYDEAYLTNFKFLVDSKVSATAAKEEAERKSMDEKKVMTQAKNLHRSLSLRLDRVDKVLDTYRSYLSNLKQDMKHG